MKRLEPLKSGKPEIITSIVLTEELANLIEAEQARIHARSRSEVIRLILDMYFNETDV